ncbi:MAG: chemotaxis protein CheW [Methanomicrobiales archaeon HGW-Methanomicrobiales-1]|jgi:purine-binding chemotaxis protein CheW|nr:MAG: chemotaxis protein CheW [Methanomicrobiales archaeon HGW-Methanomicrobiales-1]
MAKTAGEKEVKHTPSLSGSVPPAELAETKKDQHQKGKLQVVEFLLGKEHYAVDLFDVREVVEYTSITKLPNTPSYMKGIIDLRGEITTIIDLKERLNILEKSDIPEENSRIIVLDEKITKAKTGIMVDDVLAVSTFERGDIDSTSASGAREDAAILGIIKKKIKEKEHERHELIIWIDIRHLLRDIGEG